MKTLLVPTDFSDTAYNALIYACHLAHEMNGSIIILNSYQIPATQTNVMIDFKDLLERDSSDGLKEVMLKLNDEAVAEGLTITTKNYYGFLYEGVNNIEHENHIDLIVMGTTGASNFSKKIFGSNTSRLLKQTKTPILAIPPTATWNGWKNTVVATDLSSNSLTDFFKPLKAVTNGMKLNFDILHVIEDVDKKVDSQKMETEITNLIGEKSVDFHYVPAETVAAGILTYTSSHPCDILVMIRKNYNFFERMMRSSATQKLSLHSKNPLLLLQE